jgi:hypothetical protein
MAIANHLTFSSFAQCACGIFLWREQCALEDGMRDGSDNVEKKKFFFDSGDKSNEEARI